MKVTLKILEDLEFGYDPQTGAVWRKQYYTYGIINKEIYSDRYRIGGYSVPVSRIAWMLYHKVELQPWEHVGHRNGNAYDHRMDNLFLRTMKRMSRIGEDMLHSEDRLGSAAVESLAAQRRLERQKAQSIAHYFHTEWSTLYRSFFKDGGGLDLESFESNLQTVHPDVRYHIADRETKNPVFVFDDDDSFLSLTQLSSDDPDVQAPYRLRVAGKVRP